MRTQVVLICGWQDTPFMLELLRELDRGTGALPKVRLLRHLEWGDGECLSLPVAWFRRGSV